MTTNRRAICLIFSFLSVAGSGSVACGDLLVAPKGLANTAESVTDKLRRYLLDKSHPVGGSKA